jgi:hypothetical protein
LHPSPAKAFGRLRGTQHATREPLERFACESREFDEESLWPIQSQLQLQLKRFI